ncbi:MAG: TolC family protein [Endomicrobia bacterium]|nr:TolC family protein [Endomicrobiia bacterium]
MKSILVILILFFLSQLNFLLAKSEFLDCAITIAVQRNKKLQAKQKEVELAQRQLWVTTRAFLPTLYVQHRHSFGRTQLDEYRAEDLWLRGIQPLYAGGQISASHRYSILALEYAKIDYTKLKEEIITKVKQAYYEYLSSLLEVREIEKLASDIEFYYKMLLDEYSAKAISELELQEGKVFKEKVDNMLERSKRNKKLYEERLVKLVGVESIEDIPFPITTKIVDEPPKEIDFTFDQLKNLLIINNPDLKKSELNIQMGKQKQKVVTGKTKPKFYLEGSYGRSGEAYVKEPLVLTTVWSAMVRLVWLFGGSSLEVGYQKDRTIPREIVDVSQRIDTTIIDTKLGIFDDLRYFAEKKEVETTISHAEAEYEDTKNVLLLELEKFYNEYYTSLLDAKVAYSDLNLKKWRLDTIKKKRDIYETSTLDVMSNIYSVSEAVLTYTKSVVQNYIAVAEIEKLVLLPLR